MITDSLIRKKFVRDTLHKGISKIYATQESVVRNNYQLRTGRLMTSLSKHSYESNLGTDSHIIFVRILPYLRFLDMGYRLRNDRVAKFRRRNLAVYNRVVWGVLYHETFPQIRYGFTDEVRKTIHNQLDHALNP